MKFESIGKVPGVKIGHSQNFEAGTGCTVILCDEGTVGGVDQRGGAPGTRETDLLRPMHLVNYADAVVLTGGSANGLDAAGGVMRYLEEKGRGYKVGPTTVPIVPAAVINDLTFLNHKVRPDAKMGYDACLNASFSKVEQGNFGAGTGATVGKLLGAAQSMKAGIGHAALELGGGVWVGAIFVVNALGDIVSTENGRILAGTRTIRKGLFKVGSEPYFADTVAFMGSVMGQKSLSLVSKSNTVIGAVITNAKLSKEEANKFAQTAHNGLALTVRPAHTMFDGDTIFALSTGKKSSNINSLCAYAPIVCAQAIMNAVIYAEPMGGLPAYQDSLFLE